MSEPSDADSEGIDFVVVAYRDDGSWQVVPIDPTRVADVESFADELRRFPGDNGSLGMVSVDEDFLLLVRVSGPGMNLLLSDITAACDWPLARSAVEYLDLPVPDVDDDPVPAGDPGILADLGMGASDMGALLDDDLYPDEILGDIAARIGCGREFGEVVGVSVP